MAPSRRRAASATPASVYSGAHALRGLDGANPVRGRGPAATAKKIGRPLPSLGARRRDLPPDLCDVIDDALEADPGLRPSTRELAAELRDAERTSPARRSRGARTLERLGIASARRLILPRGGDWLARLGAGAALGGLVAAALAGLGPTPPFSVAAVAAGQPSSRRCCRA